jgi:hypothetical protein
MGPGKSLRARPPRKKENSDAIPPLAVCTGPDFRKRKKSRNQISRIWTGMRHFCERTRLSPKSHARLATPKTPTTRGSRPQKLEGPCRRISEPSSFGLRSGQPAGN